MVGDSLSVIIHIRGSEGVKWELELSGLFLVENWIPMHKDSDSSAKGQ